MTKLDASSPGGASGNSLKEQNRWQLWIIVAVNSLFLWGVIQANAIRVDGLRGVFADAEKLLPMGFAIVIATVLNGVLSAETKARLVFLRWNHVLPGHRAFSEYSKTDPRIDPEVLTKIAGSPSLPIEPAEQNRLWYRIYRTVETDPAVRQVHRDFLLLRDYSGLCVLFIMFYGTATLYVMRPVTLGLLYLSLLILQYLVVRQAGANYGIRLVTTVLAVRTAEPANEPSRMKNAVTKSQSGSRRK